LYIGINVHGGELAGTDASVLAAYYFVAATDAETLKNIKETVILIEPSLNPDGRDRATSYFNTFNSTPPVADPNDIEHAGVLHRIGGITFDRFEPGLVPFSPFGKSGSCCLLS
jgi:hypothetical protein